MSKKMSGLEIQDISVGTGREALKGTAVTVHFVGRLNKGDVFVDTRQYGMTSTFRVGSHKAVIPAGIPAHERDTTPLKLSTEAGVRVARGVERDGQRVGCDRKVRNRQGGAGQSCDQP